MTQSDAFKVLKKKKKWMTSKEVSKILEISTASATLKKLYEQGEILRREFNDRGNHFVYQYKYKI